MGGGAACRGGRLISPQTLATGRRLARILWERLPESRREPHFVGRVEVWGDDEWDRLMRTAGVGPEEVARSQARAATLLALTRLRREHALPTMESVTDTVACPFCDSLDRAESGGSPHCQVSACYRGRISGYASAHGDSGGRWSGLVPLSPVDRIVVQKWLLDLHVAPVVAPVLARSAGPAWLVDRLERRTA